MVTAINEYRKEKRNTEMVIGVDINRAGREFISRTLYYNSKEYNRIKGEALKIVFVEKAIQAVINEYVNKNDPVYEISASDSIDGIKTVIYIRREYILDTRIKAA